MRLDDYGRLVLDEHDDAYGDHAEALERADRLADMSPAPSPFRACGCCDHGLVYQVSGPDEDGNRDVDEYECPECDGTGIFDETRVTGSVEGSAADRTAGGLLAPSIEDLCPSRRCEGMDGQAGATLKPGPTCPPALAVELASVNGVSTPPKAGDPDATPSAMLSSRVVADPVCAEPSFVGASLRPSFRRGLRRHRAKPPGLSPCQIRRWSRRHERTPRRSVVETTTPSQQLRTT